jgi:hypothetical protein
MSDTDNPSCVLLGNNNLEIEDRKVPELSDNDVLVKIIKTGMFSLLFYIVSHVLYILLGLCGSDVSYFASYHINALTIRLVTLSRSWSYR